MSRFSRQAQEWRVFINGRLSPQMQPLRIEESMGAGRLDVAELVLDPAFAGPIQDYSPLDEIGGIVEIEAVGVGVKHYGTIVQVLPVFSEQGEIFKYVSQTKHSLFGIPAGGVIMFSPSFPPAPEISPPFDRQPKGQFKLVDDKVVFNPEIDGRIAGNMHSRKRYSDQQVPIFLNPEAVRTAAGQRLHQGTAINWTLSNAVYYLCWTLNRAEEIASNPSLPTLVQVFRDSVDFLNNVEIKDGDYLPEALDDLLNPLGYSWRLAKGGRARRILEFFRRNEGGRLVTVKHQRFGETFDPAKTNVAQHGITFDASRLANKIIGRGSKLMIEITAELHRAWLPSYDNEARESLKLSALDANSDKRHAYRKWVLNEGGDYIGLRPEITQEFTPTVRRLLNDGGWLEWMVPCRREFKPTLTQKDDGSGPIGTLHGIEVEYLNAAGEWTPVTSKWAVKRLEHECGIEIASADVPEELIDLRGDARIRVTATIETDFRITAIAERQFGSPLAFDNTAILDLDHQFHWREVTKLSKYSGRTSGKTIAQDDRDALYAFVVSLRNRWDSLDVAGSIALEGVDQDGYQVGDRISGVAGKNISFASTRTGTSYPQIVGITYDIEGQRTLLQLQRFREKVKDVVL